jgi:AmiR/NasT family two-component response regulator
MGRHGSQFRIQTVDMEERDDLARQVMLLSEAVNQLERALEHSWGVGVATGIVMAREGVSQEGALDLLRALSRHERRKLSVIVAEVIESGVLPSPLEEIA